MVIVNLPHYKTMIDKSPIGILLIREHRVLYANSYVVDMYGYDDNLEIIHQPVSQLQPPDLREKLRTRGDLRLEGSNLLPRTENYFTAGLKKDGTIFNIEVTATRIVLDDGPAVLAYLRDLSDQVSLKSKLAKSIHYPFMLAKMALSGPKIIYSDFDDLPCEIDEDLNIYLMNNLVTTYSLIGRGSTYGKGISQIPAGICDDLQMLVYSFSLPDMNPEDPRLKLGYFQFIMFVPKYILSLSGSLLRIEGVFEGFVSRFDTFDDLVSSNIAELKSELLDNLLEIVG